MRVLVAGLGSIGTRHGRNLRTLGIDALVGFDPDAERRAAFAAELGAGVTDDYAAGVAAADLVVVASPNRFHVGQALEAARAGRALFVEKPLGSTAEGVVELMEAVRARGVFAHVGSNWKFYPAFQAMKRLVEDGTIGPVAGAQVLAGQWLPDWHPTRDYRLEYSARRDLGGGILLDCHEFDYLSWLLGPVAGVKALWRHTGFLATDTEDVAAVALRFAGGAVASLQVDYIQRAGRRRYNLAGRDGTLEWEIGQPLRCYRAETGGWDDVEGTLETDYNAMYVRQMAHCLDGARSGGTPVSSIEWAARVLDVQLAAGKDGAP